MKVCDHVGVPVMIPFEASRAFGIHPKQEVPVEVKPVMVGPSPGPALIVLDVVLVRNERVSPENVRPVAVPVPSVRIDCRVDKDDGLAQELFDLLALGRHQGVGREQGGLGAGGLIAVNPIGQVHEEREAGMVRDVLVGIHHLKVPFPDLLQVPDVLRGSDREDEQLSVLMGLTIDAYRGLVR